MNEYEIGSRHVVWINPFCCDTMAEVVSYDENGNPVMRTDDDENMTLMPGEYVFPTEEDRKKLEMISRYFDNVYGEEI